MSDDTAQSYFRSAIAEDAEAIYRVKLGAFGTIFLPFTIYRSAKSVLYLRKVISDAGKSVSRGCVKVAVRGGAVAGYYMATPVGETYFLNYIAVAEWAKGVGLGKLLLENFEVEAQRLGFRSVGLDVFASNSDVLAWYSRHGYRLRTRSFAARIAVGRMPADGPRVNWREADWLRALDEEAQQGFSRFSAWLEEGSVSVGLIDGCAARLLVWERVDLGAAVSAVAGALRELRSEMILVGVDTVQPEWPLIALEESLRLERVLP
jgi:ribosomal protein S18 acetylase RimI-like enzyme